MDLDREVMLLKKSIEEIKANLPGTSASPSRDYTILRRAIIDLGQAIENARRDGNADIDIVLKQTQAAVDAINARIDAIAAHPALSIPALDEAEKPPTEHGDGDDQRRPEA